MDKITLAEKFARFSEHWTPKIVGEANGHYVKLAKAQGEMIWHSHADEDELFLVFHGALTLHFREYTVTLEPGELCIVPRGVEHKTSAVVETHFMMIEPTTTAHTGSVVTERTIPHERQEWL